MSKPILGGLLLLGLLVSAAIGIAVATIQSNAVDKKTTEVASDVTGSSSAAFAKSKFKIVSTSDLTSADAGVVRLKEIYPYRSIDWGVAPSNLAWTTLTIELPSDIEAADALAVAFAYRNAEITTSLAPHVRSLTERWLVSDRTQEIEEIHGDWVVSVGGYASPRTFRITVSIGWPGDFEH